MAREGVERGAGDSPISARRAKTLIFPVDYPNETEKNRIAKFGYSGHPNSPECTRI
jgi:hypothetical protein